MKDKQILDHLNNSINDAPINILNNIKNAKIVKMTEHDEITRQEDTQNNIINFYNPRLFRTLASAAAVFLLIFIGFYQFRIPDSQIYLDINPSIQITTNKRDKVIELTALNEESISLIDDIDYKNKELEEVTGEIMDSLALESILSSTYMNDDKSVLLVSVYNEDSNKSDEQAEKLDKFVRAKIDSYDLHPVILTQSINKSNTVDEFAEKYDISVGKMTFIRNLILLDPSLETEELVKLSLYELLEISINTGIDIDTIVNSGNDERVHTPPSTEATTEESGTTPSIQEDETRDDDDDNTSSPTSSNPKPTQAKSTTAPTKASRKPISMEEAKRIALARTNGGTIVDADQDDDEFEIEIINGNIKYDVEVNLYGDVTDFDSESIDDDDDDYDDIEDDYSETGRNIISMEEAKRIALARTNGGTIVEADQDDEEFEFEIINGSIEYDVEVNLYGDITGFDSESVDDD